MAYDKSRNEVSERSSKGVDRKSERPVDDKHGSKGREIDDREVCRNFTQNRCKRGSDCKFRHPAKGAEEIKSDNRSDGRVVGRSESRPESRPESKSELPSRKRSRSRSPVRRSREGRREVDRNVHSKANSDTSFPHSAGKGEKWLNCCREFIKGNCQRTECRFLHVGQEDEDFFMQRGEITKFVTEQAVRILLEIDAPLNGRPVCKANIQGRCLQSSCRSRHVNLVELEHEVSMKVKEEFQSFLNQPSVPNMNASGVSPNIPSMDGGMNQMGGNNFGGIGPGGSGWSDSSMQMIPNMNNMGNMNLPNRDMPMSRPMGGNNMDMSFNDSNQGFKEQDNRIQMEMKKKMDQEAKELSLKTTREIQRLEEAKTKAEGLLKISDTVKQNLKENLAQAEEMAKHQKEKFDMLNTELKEMDAAKLKLGLMARRVLGDIPAIEAKLIPSWANQVQMNSEVLRWQEVCQNLRSLVQNILGVDVGSLTTPQPQMQSSLMSSDAYQMGAQASSAGISPFQTGMQQMGMQQSAYQQSALQQSSMLQGSMSQTGMQQYGSGVTDRGSSSQKEDRSRNKNSRRDRNESPEAEETSSWGNTASSYGSGMYSSQKTGKAKNTDKSSLGGGGYGSTGNNDADSKSYWANQDSVTGGSFWSGPQSGSTKKSGGYSSNSYGNGSGQY